jgi:hypothetical protein
MRTRRFGWFLVLAAAFSLARAGTRPTGATVSPDYTRRNEAFAPAATRVPKRPLPANDRILPAPRVRHPIATEKTVTAVGDRRARIDISETRAKLVIEPDVHPRSAAQTKRLNPFNHRKAHIATASAGRTFPLVAKYRDRLAAANAAGISRVSLSGRAVLARINRFVFRKNRTASAPASVTSAGSANANDKRWRADSGPRQARASAQ